MRHLVKVCLSTTKPQRWSNWNSDQESRKNPKKTGKKMLNLRTGWINGETSSEDESDAVYAMNNEDSSVQVNFRGKKTK